MMNFHTCHPLQPFWNLAAAPIQSQALSLALEHGLFELLRAPQGATAVSENLGLRGQSVGVWLDMLWSLGLLGRGPGDDPLYSLTEVTQRFFLEDAPENCAQAWQYRTRVLAASARQMDELLRQLPRVEPPLGGWAQAAQVQIHQEQLAVSVPQVLTWLTHCPGLPERGHFLDLGGGPGHVAIALARALPGWRGTLCELPETAAVAAAHIQRAGLGERLDVQPCDLNQHALAGDYELIWCSSVLHFVQDPQAVLGKIFAALRPGGRVVLAHAEIAHDADLAAQVLPFYLPMMMRGHYVPRSGEIARAMQYAGFTDVQSSGRVAFPMAPVCLYTGCRP